MGANSTTNYYGSVPPPVVKYYVQDKLKASRGLTFPIGASRDQGGFLSASTGHKKVTNALHQLLQTERGERVMLPKFGCNLQKYMFQPLDADIFRAIKKEILYSCQNYLQGASVIKLKVLKGNDIGKWGESSLHILLTLQMHEDDQTVFSEEVIIQ